MHKSTDLLLENINESNSGLTMDSVPETHVVILNVGGTEMHVLQTTLSCVPGSRLRRLFATNSWPTDNEGRYFIDRDPIMFRHVLGYLRDGSETPLPNCETSLNQLRREAIYFILPGLQKIVETKLQSEECATNELSVIRLRVGGRQFETCISVVHAGTPEGSVLRQIFNSVNDSPADPNTPIFIDRNGDIFEYILEYLRDGSSTVLPVDDPLTLRRIRREAQFFQLPHLVAMIEEILKMQRPTSSLEECVKKMEKELKRICDCISYEYDPYNKNKCKSKLCVCMTDQL